MTLRKEEKVEFEREITKSPFWRTYFRRDYVSVAWKITQYLSTNISCTRTQIGSKMYIDAL
jgi:uncharacterized protein VirK/YbjX